MCVQLKRQSVVGVQRIRFMGEEMYCVEACAQLFIHINVYCVFFDNGLCELNSFNEFKFKLFNGC